MHSRWSRPGNGHGRVRVGGDRCRRVYGRGGEPRSVAHGVAGTGAPWRVAGARPVPVGPGPALRRQTRLRICSPPSHPTEIRSDCWQSSRSVNRQPNWPDLHRGVADCQGRHVFVMLDHCWRRSAPDRFGSERTRVGQCQPDMAGLPDWDSVEEWLSLPLIARRSHVSAGQS